MDEQKKSTKEKGFTPNLGANRRNRHDRETNAVLGKPMFVSRENVRKIGLVDSTAPAVLSDAMGKTISIHKAFEINKLVQRLPEDEREAAALWLIQKEAEDRENGVYREKVVARKLDNVMSLARRSRQYFTPEGVDIYLKYNSRSIADIADLIDGEIYWLTVLQKIFQSRAEKPVSALAYGEGIVNEFTK